MIPEGFRKHLNTSRIQHIMHFGAKNLIGICFPDGIVFFSYCEPVAAIWSDYGVKTNEKFSPTTSRHMKVINSHYPKIRWAYAPHAELCLLVDILCVKDREDNEPNPVVVAHTTWD